MTRSIVLDCLNDMKRDMNLQKNSRIIQIVKSSVFATAIIVRCIAQLMNTFE